MDEKIKGQLDSISKSIDEKIEVANVEIVETLVAKTNDVVVTEVKTFSDRVNERLDAMEIANKKQFNVRKKVSFKNALTEAIDNGAIEGLQKGNASSAKFVVKADMKISADFTGEVIPADRVPGYKFDPTRPIHVRDLLAQGTTSSDVVRYVKESGYNNGADAKSEGAALAQSDFDMTAVDANVRKIGTYFRISEEMLADTPQLTSYISSRAPEKLLQVEDDQILNGNGFTPNLSGIITDATAFDTSANGAFYQSVESANEFDVLVAALNQLASLDYNADCIMLNPTDFHKILLLKDSNNNYLKDQVYAGLTPNFMGVKVVNSTAITAGDFLCGNFGVGTQLWVRDGINVEFFKEDGVNVREGFVTIRVSERIALTNYLPNAFVKGTFSSAKTALETP